MTLQLEVGPAGVGGNGSHARQAEPHRLRIKPAVTLGTGGSCTTPRATALPSGSAHLPGPAARAAGAGDGQGAERAAGNPGEPPRAGPQRLQSARYRGAGGAGSRLQGDSAEVPRGNHAGD